MNNRILNDSNIYNYTLINNISNGLRIEKNVFYYVWSYEFIYYAKNVITFISENDAVIFCHCVGKTRKHAIIKYNVIGRRTW